MSSNAFDEAVKAAATRLRDLWGTSMSPTDMWLRSQLRDLFRPLFDEQAEEIKRLKQLIVDYREAKQPWGPGGDSYEKCPQCQKYYMKKGIKRCESCVNADINAALAEKPRSGAGKPEGKEDEV